MKLVRNTLLNGKLIFPRNVRNNNSCNNKTKSVKFDIATRNSTWYRRLGGTIAVGFSGTVFLLFCNISRHVRCPSPSSHNRYLFCYLYVLQSWQFHNADLGGDRFEIRVVLSGHRQLTIGHRARTHHYRGTYYRLLWWGNGPPLK